MLGGIGHQPMPHPGQQESHAWNVEVHTPPPPKALESIAIVIFEESQKITLNCNQLLCVHIFGNS